MADSIVKVVGIGGCGFNIVNNIADKGIKNVEYVAIDTQKDIEVIKGLFSRDQNCVAIIVAGMDGDTGTDISPTVAEIAKKAGALVIAVIYKPLNFEKLDTLRNAQEGIEKLSTSADSFIVIPDSFIAQPNRKTSKQSFDLVNDIMYNGVLSILNIINQSNDINIDFEDMKSVLQNQGEAFFGIGYGEGDNRAVDAAKNVISNPMIEHSNIEGASKILIKIISDESLAMTELEEIVSNIQASASNNAEIFLGLSTNMEMKGKISVTVIATGFGNMTKTNGRCNYRALAR